MLIKVSIYYLIYYCYDKLVFFGFQVICLWFVFYLCINVILYSLKVSLVGYFVNYQLDFFGNWLVWFVFFEFVCELKIEVDLVVDMIVYNLFDFFIEESVEFWFFEYLLDLVEELVIYCQFEFVGLYLQVFLEIILCDWQCIMDFIVVLNVCIVGLVGYIIWLEFGVQMFEEILGIGLGLCCDSSWLLVQVLWYLGFVVCFVLGYLIQLKLDLKVLDGLLGMDQDFIDLYVWVEVYIFGVGWIGLDLILGLLIGESYILLVVILYYCNVVLISGGYIGQVNIEFDFDMQVWCVVEYLCIIKFFSDVVWDELNVFGEKVDQVLVVGDVCLIMGGELIFVLIDDFESDEWNIVVVGLVKCQFVDMLICCLCDCFVLGGFLYYGQGKWYLGEMLLCWIFLLFWCCDGQLVW